MNILYITYDGLTDPLGRSQVLPYLCGLADKNHSIVVLSCDKPLNYQKSKDNVQTIVDKHNIKWISVVYNKKTPIISPLGNIQKMQQKAIKLCHQHHFDIVHCRSYLASKIGLSLKHKFGLKFIFDMRGFFADERVDGNVWNLSNPIYYLVYKYFKYKEKQFFNQADYIVSLTQAGKNIIQNQFGISTPIMVIPCCADLDHFSTNKINENQQNKLRQQLHLQDSDFVISYVGSLGTWYMLDEMFDFVHLLMQTKTSVKFLLITPDDENKIQKIAQQHQIDINQIIIKRAEREDVPLYISLSSISLFFIKPVFSKQASSPTKMGEILSMGIPIIANAGVGDVDAIIKDTHCGIIVNQFNNNSYLEAINNIDYMLSSNKSTYIAAAQKYYSLTTGIERYNTIYQELNK